MIFLEPTPNYAGVTLYGDYEDLVDLYDTISRLSNCQYINNSNLEDYLLGLCYDIRRAYQGEKNINKYYSVKILLPVLLFQFRTIRWLAGFSPTSSRDHSNIFRLQSCLEDIFKKVNLDLSDKCIRDLICNYNLSTDFLISFMHNICADYIEMTKQERKDNIYDILTAMNPLSPTYLKFEQKMKTEAKRLNKFPYELKLDIKNKDFEW